MTPDEIANLKLQARIAEVLEQAADALLDGERLYRRQAEKRVKAGTVKARESKADRMARRIRQARQLKAEGLTNPAIAKRIAEEESHPETPFEVGTVRRWLRAGVGPKRAQPQ